MIVEDLYIDRYDWHLRVFYAVDCNDTRDVIDELRRLNARGRISIGPTGTCHRAG